MNHKHTTDLPSYLADHESFGPDESLEQLEAVTACAESGVSEAVDRALGLKPISIRLDTKLLEQLKEIAKFHGIGYQPMVRDLLKRFARSEIKAILDLRLRELSKAEEVEKEGTEPVTEFLTPMRKTT